VLAVWPQVTAEALGVVGPIQRYCPCSPVYRTTCCVSSRARTVRAGTCAWCGALVAVVQSLHLEEDGLRPGRELDLQVDQHPMSAMVASCSVRRTVDLF
jgi:hypothetical protein